MMSHKTILNWKPIVDVVQVEACMNHHRVLDCRCRIFCHLAVVLVQNVLVTNGYTEFTVYLSMRYGDFPVVESSKGQYFSLFVSPKSDSVGFRGSRNLSQAEVEMLRSFLSLEIA